MKQFIIREDLLNTVVNYLAKQPFNEVQPLIEAIQHGIADLEAYMAEAENEDEEDTG